MQQAQRFIVEPGEGEVLQEADVGVVAKVWGHETNGVLSIVEHPVTPGVLVPPHTHADFDEWSYVLEGEVGSRVGEVEMTAGPGALHRADHAGRLRTVLPGARGAVPRRHLHARADGGARGRARHGLLRRLGSRSRGALRDQLRATEGLLLRAGRRELRACLENLKRLLEDAAAA